jgi:hypothetical protein
MTTPITTGIIDIVVSGTMGSSEAFVSLYKFLTSANAQAYGINLIAQNCGAGGIGFDYWNQASYIGNNAWAVFQWSKANTPFYVLIQYATGTFGLSPGNPGSCGSVVGNSLGVGIQVAMLADGSDPWNGTKVVTGSSDTKSSPVWVDTNNVGLYVWPRANSFSGSYETNKERCLPAADDSDIKTYGARIHFMADKENFAILKDTFNTVNSYECMWFGRYTQFQFIDNYGPTPTARFSASCPYAMTWNWPDTNVSYTYPYTADTVYGTTTGVGSYEGGIAHYSASCGVVGAGVGSLGWMYTSGHHPSTILSAPAYEVMPLLLCMNEAYPTTNSLGTVGYSGDFIRHIFGATGGDTTSDLLWVVAGSNTKAASKLLFPWDGKTTPNFTKTVGSRTGSIY